MMAIQTEALLKKFVPPLAVPYCLDLWKRYPFELDLKGSRTTKVGDFCARRGSTPKITLNRDLSPFLFLVTYIHEFSHHAVWMVYGHSPQPHGKEWKLAFKTFMGPIMDLKIFPEDLQARLNHHLINPKASSFSDQKLTALFRKYDPLNTSAMLVSSIPQGSTFSIRGKVFQKGNKRRTRFECIEVKTRRLYLVPADLPIDQ